MILPCSVLWVGLLLWHSLVIFVVVVAVVVVVVQNKPYLIPLLFINAASCWERADLLALLFDV